MGQSQSMEQVFFMTSLQALMKREGSKVSKKALQQFFCTVSDLCPWFPKEGTVSLDAWQKVGQEIKNHLKEHGPMACPPGTMHIWEEIRETLDPQHTFELISIASHESLPENDVQTSSEEQKENNKSVIESPSPPGQILPSQFPPRQKLQKETINKPQTSIPTAPPLLETEEVKLKEMRYI